MLHYSLCVSVLVTIFYMLEVQFSTIYVMNSLINM